MNKKYTVAIVIIASAATACASYAWNDKPDFLQAAESRVSSYLTSDYGRVACASTKTDEQRWELNCQNQAKGKHFQFAVFPAEKAPYKVSRSFYLEAMNDEARQSAGQGLIQYLQINTDKAASKSS